MIQNFAKNREDPDVTHSVLGESITTAFEARVKTSPNAVAMIAESEWLSYAQLDHKSNRLAQKIQAYGVGPEVVVGLSVHRSPYMLVALIAIWKAGGALLPLDLSYPAAWTELIVRDSGISLVLTESAFVEQMYKFVPCVLCIDQDPDDISSVVEPAGRGHAHIDQLAYCIYTSGTTGRPKGVSVGWRGLLAHARAIQRRLALRPVDRVLQMTPLTIDASLEEILPTLLAGATIVLPTAAMFPGTRFMSFLDEYEVTIVSLATPLWEQWIDCPQAQSWKRPTHLRTVFVGGERVLAEKLRRWQRLPWTPEIDWIMDYGPTEATISCTTWYPGRWFEGDTVPIGSPIPGATVQLLDRALEPVAEGKMGEIWIGGASPARGYLGQPALTADAFRPDPRGEPGSRMYRSGDLGRLSPDGQLLFLGRSDEQIKLFGHRIEISAVESAILSCEGVREAVVGAHQPPSSDPILVGYLVGEALDIPRIRRQLANSLPPHMVPHKFVLLEELPRTRTGGKLDRRSLSPLTLSPKAGISGDLVSDIVIRRWTEAIGQSSTGDRSDFFREGGDSLRGLRLIVGLRDELDVDIDFVDLHRNSRLGEFISLIEERRQAGRSADSPDAGLLSESRSRPRRSDPLRLPASHGQRRFWFLEQFHEGAASYSVPLLFDVRGTFQVSELDLAFGRIIERHEGLRTGLVCNGDLVLQFIGPSYTFATKELRACSQAKAMEFAIAEIVQPFDLAKPPLIRSTSIEYAFNARLWVLNFHHSICDAWSLALLFDELHKELLGVSPQDLPPQNRDHSLRQKAWLKSPQAEAQRTFWREELGVSLPRLHLDHGIGQTQAGPTKGGLQPLSIVPSLYARLCSEARKLGTTPYVIVLSAFVAVLHRWTLQHRLVVGVPSACRTTPSDEAIIGFLSNTLAIRIDLEQGACFTQLLEQVGWRLANAIANQELPFDCVVDTLGLSDRAVPNPLFQAMFVMQDAPVGHGLQVPGCFVEEIAFHNGTAKMDISMMLRTVGDRVEGEIEYALNVMTPATAGSFAQAFLNILESALLAPSNRLDELSAVSSSNRAALIDGANRGYATYDDSFELGREVSAHAIAQPDTIAVVASDATLSYAELDRRANGIADALTASGVKTECLVGICMDRSAAMIAALLGVLRTGAAFVPLSPRAPQARLKSIVKDAGIKYAIVEKTYKALLEGAGLHQWLEEDLRGEGHTTAPVTIWPSQIAYIYYTSGSTGIPKGVAIEHRCAMNRLAWLRRRYPLRPGERVLHKTPLVFDVAIWEIFGPLAAGATIVAADPDSEADAQHIAELLASPGTVFGHFVPSMLDAWLRADPGPHCVDLKWVQMSGEAPSPELVERFRVYTDVPLHNCYGQTETSEVANWEDDGEALQLRVPIGRQVGIYRLFVLDRSLEPVPQGMPGELCVAGIGGLARGYLNHPAWTAERFVPNPFPAVPGERLYRTGDIVIVNSDGILEALGRNDRQIKVRGCRVEIAEVERVLLNMVCVHRCAVIAKQDPELCDYLVAYVVGEQVSPEELGYHAEQHLPDYMLPSVYMVMDELPMTESGKLDCLLLPAPTAAAFQLRGGSSSPELGLESELARLWREVLQIELLGRRDNFFAIGGNSLKAIQVLTRIQGNFGIRLSVRAFFADPTLCGLARLVDEKIVELVASMSDDEAALRLEDTAV